MNCYFPMRAFLRRSVPEDNITKLFPPGGKNTVLFSPRKFYDALGLIDAPELFSRYYEPIILPCGKCIACRIKHAKQMAARAWFEAQQYKVFDKEIDLFGSKVELTKLNCAFITLTLSDDYMLYRTQKLGIPYMKLAHQEFQLFMKRLRKKTGLKIRYFMCGEYGPKNGRPHYHAIIYGYDFPDKVCTVVTEHSKYFASQILADLWRVYDSGKPVMSMGFTSIAEVNEAVCQYVAQYVIKKLENCENDGSYIRCSTNPGIGFLWLQDNQKFYLEQSYLTFNNFKMSLPRYYDEKLKELYPEYYTNVIIPRRRQYAYEYCFSKQSTKEALQYARKKNFERMDF